MNRFTRSSVSLFALSLVSACAGEPPANNGGATEAAAVPAPATVTITAPLEGADIGTTTVTVRLSVAALRIVTAGDTTSGTGHHHLYLDADLAPAGTPVPSVPGSIIHMGDGSAEYVFTDVAPGEHRLIAVVGDGFHVPLDPLVVDTVMFTVNQ